MRKLIMSDVYKMSKILSKLDLKLDVKDKDQQEVGADFILKLGSNLHKAEAEVNEFMGGLIGLSAEDFGNLEFAESAKHLEDFKNLKGVKDFLKLAAKSMKQK